MIQPCSMTGLNSRDNVSGFNESLILMPAPGSGACAAGAAAAGVAVAMASLVAVADARPRKERTCFLSVGLGKSRMEAGRAGCRRLR